MLHTLALLSGIAMAFAILPQAYKIYRDKASRDVSTLTFVILTAGSFIWLLYGLDIKDDPITWSYAVRLAASVGVLFLIYRYSRRKPV